MTSSTTPYTGTCACDVCIYATTLTLYMCFHYSIFTICIVGRCARNLHLMATKMLFRAGAKLNVTTELGNTPLDLAVMIQHPQDKRKIQIKLVKYLLENGAQVNTRDKGGHYTPFSETIHDIISFFECIRSYVRRRVLPDRSRGFQQRPGNNPTSA